MAGGSSNERSALVQAPHTTASNADTMKLYTMNCMFALCSRMWDFSLVVFLTQLVPGSLILVGLMGLLENLAVITLSGYVGIFLDKTDRLVAVTTLLVVQCFITTTVIMLFAWQFSAVNEPNEGTFKRVIGYCIPLAAAFAQVGFSGVTLAIEKDWIVVFAAGDFEWLSHTNSVMTQIDLACDTLAPAAVGFVFTYLPMDLTAVLFCGIQICAIIIMCLVLRTLYEKTPALHVREKQAETGSQSSSLCGSSWINKFIQSEALVAFVRCGCVMYLLGFASIFLTALNFGSLMLSYALSKGMHVSVLGICRALSALAGFFGAFIFPWHRKRFGLVNATVASIWFQFSLLVLAESSFFIPGVSSSAEMLTMILVLFTPVILSRTGLWMFDLGVRQIAQEVILEEDRGKVNGVWRGLCSVFEMSSYVLALIFHKPDQFWILCTVSLGMVGLGAVLVTFATIKLRVTEPSSFSKYNLVPDDEAIAVEQPVEKTPHSVQ